MVNPYELQKKMLGLRCKPLAASATDYARISGTWNSLPGLC